MDFIAAKVFFKEKKIILNNFIKEIPFWVLFIKDIKTKRQIIINFTYGLIMEPMHTWH